MNLRPLFALTYAIALAVAAVIACAITITGHAWTGDAASTPRKTGLFDAPGRDGNPARSHSPITTPSRRGSAPPNQVSPRR